MTRAELTVEIMKDRGFNPVTDETSLKDIVFNIQENENWRYLRCVIDDEHIYSTTEYGMCSTYEIIKKMEYLEVSSDNETWNRVAWRFVEVNRRCVYAD